MALVVGLVALLHLHLPLLMGLAAVALEIHHLPPLLLPLPNPMVLAVGLPSLPDLEHYHFYPNA
jgi:hypothetical protein